MVVVVVHNDEEREWEEEEELEEGKGGTPADRYGGGAMVKPSARCRLPDILCPGAPRSCRGCSVGRGGDVAAGGSEGEREGLEGKREEQREEARQQTRSVRGGATHRKGPLLHPSPWVVEGHEKEEEEKEVRILYTPAGLIHGRLKGKEELVLTRKEFSEIGIIFHTQEKEEEEEEEEREA